jgi:hypothetical protein
MCRVILTIGYFLKISLRLEKSYISYICYMPLSSNDRYWRLLTLLRLKIKDIKTTPELSFFKGYGCELAKNYVF